MPIRITEVPFNRFLGLRIAAEPTELLQLPAGGDYLNHLGTVHAGAQLALAEASSGEFLLRAFGDDDLSVTGAGVVVPVVRRVEAKFRQPARGCLTTRASTAPGAMEQLRADLAAKGRAFVRVTVELHDETGAHTLSATVEWFIARSSAAAEDRSPGVAALS